MLIEDIPKATFFMVSFDLRNDPVFVKIKRIAIGDGGGDVTMINITEFSENRRSR